MSIFNEKERFFFRRTIEHIHRVQLNALTLIEYPDRFKLTLEDCRRFAENVLLHDRSKFCEAQFLPYLEFTWNKKIDPKGDYSLGDAWKDHYTKENHHPEKYRGKLNSFDLLETLEMACDMQAMAQEFGEGSCRKYFENVWKKHHLNDWHDDFDWEKVTVTIDGAITIFELCGPVVEVP